MPLSDAASHSALDALTLSHVAAHTGYPGLSGLNEASGGSYARQTITMASASGRQRASSTTPSIPIPAGATVQFLSLWTALSGGTFQHFVPLGSSGFINYTVDATNNTIEAPSHGLSNGNQVVFIGATPPGGLTEGTLYYVVSATTDDFQVSATAGGAAIDLTNSTDTGMLSKIVPQTFSVAGNLTVSSYIVKLLAGQS